MSQLYFAIIAAADARGGLRTLESRVAKAQQHYDRAAVTAEKRAASPNPEVRARGRAAATAALDVLDDWQAKLDAAQGTVAGLEAAEKEAYRTAADCLREEPCPHLEQYRNCHA